MLLALLACSPPEPCRPSTPSCEDPEQVCVYSGGGATGYECLEPCVGEDDCDAGACTGRGASCDVCTNVIRYCE